LCDVVWWVTCHEQRARLIARGTDPADADRRIAAQAGMADRVRAARPDLVEVDTSGSLADAEARVAALWEQRPN
jgi:dephospho-CoA kinase